MTRHNKDLLIGFIPSLILPLVFMMVFIKLRYLGELPLDQVISEMFKFKYMSSLLAVGAMPNLFLFLYAMNRERWQLGRGVITATMFYGIAVMIMKLC